MRMNKLKKVISMALLASMLFSLSANVYAESVNENIIKENKEVETNLVFDNKEEYLSYIAYSIKNDEMFVVPEIETRGIGEISDFKDSVYFWQKTKTGKCIAKVISPTKIIKDVIFGFKLKELKKMGVKGIAKALTSKGVRRDVAFDIAGCIINNFGK